MNLDCAYLQKKEKTTVLWKHSCGQLLQVVYNLTCPACLLKCEKEEFNTYFEKIEVQKIKQYQCRECDYWVYGINSNIYKPCDEDFPVLKCPNCGAHIKKMNTTKSKKNQLTKSIRHEVFKRFNYKCIECGATNKETTLHVDHIQPKSFGGTDELSNLQLLCQACNLSKSNRILKMGEN